MRSPSWVADGPARRYSDGLPHWRDGNGRSRDGANPSVALGAMPSNGPDHDEDYGASDGLSCAERNGLIVPLGAVDIHIAAEHPNGTLAIAPVLTTALGEE